MGWWYLRHWFSGSGGNSTLKLPPNRAFFDIVFIKCKVFRQMASKMPISNVHLQRTLVLQ